MKQMKKSILLFLCTFALLSLTACGSDNPDNGAVNQQEDTQDQNDKKEQDYMNDATEGTRNEGVLDEAGDEVKEEAGDMAEDVRDGMEDLKK